MALDNFVHIALVHVGIPDTLRVDHDYRSFLATIEAPGIVNAHLSLAVQSKRLESFLGAIAYFLRTAVGAAWRPIVAAINTKTRDDGS